MENAPNNPSSMYRKLPPLHALTAFEAAARHQSFSKAAQELYLTHSAVSHRIRILEEHLGAQLFLRLSKRIALTPRGESFLATVRETLAALHHAASALKQHARRALRISVLPAFASSWLIQRLGDFSHHHPEIDLEVQTTGQLADLRSGEVDLAIRYGAGSWPGLYSSKLFTDRIYPVGSPHYLDTIPSIARPSDLKGTKLLRHRKLPWNGWFCAAGLDWPEPDSGPIYSDVGLMLEAAANAQGIALARDVLVAPHLERGKLVRVTQVVAPSDWHFYLVCIPEARERTEVSRFCDWLMDQIDHSPQGRPIASPSPHFEPTRVEP